MQFAAAQNKIADSLWQVYRLHPNDTVGLNALADLSIRHLSYSDPDSSQRVSIQMRKEARRIGWARGEYRYYMNIGFVENRRLHLESSLIYYDSAIQVAKRLGISYAGALGSMGGTYNRMQRYEEALRVLNEALYLAQKDPDPRMECSVSMNLSSAYGNKGDLKSSVKYALKAAEIADRDQIKDLIGRTYAMLLPSFSQTEDTTNQRIYANKLLQLGEKDQNMQFLYQAHYYLMTYCLERLRIFDFKDQPLSEPLLDRLMYHTAQAEQYLSYVKTPFERGEFWRSKARALTMTGTHQEVLEACAKARQAHPVDENSQQAVDIMITIAQSFELHGLSADSTAYYLERAGTISRLIQSHFLAARTYRQIAQHYAISPKPNFEKAYAAYIQYKVYEDSLLNTDKIREITGLELNFNFERERNEKDRNILFLQNQNLEAQLRIKDQTDALFRNKTEAEKREILLQLLGRDNNIKALFIRQQDDSLSTQQLRLQLQEARASQQLATLRAQQEADNQQRNRAIGLLAALLALGTLAFYIWRIRQKAAHQRKVSEVEMRALRAQMNPHFLFNSMNAVNGYILRNDPQAASDYLSRFARVMRNILENSQQPSITLEKEINLLKEYLKVEEMRVEQGLKYEIEIADAVDTFETRLPSMILQPFIENAIIHGIRPKKDGVGRIKICIKPENGEKIRCIIEDNGVGRSNKMASENPSMGLKITTDRLLIWHRYRIAQPIQFADLKDSTGQATGTRVEIII